MRTIEIAPKTILFTIVFLLGLYVVWIVRELFYSLFIGFILMSALRPLVSYIESKKMPHSLSVIIVYFSFVFFFLFLFSLILPPIIIESTNLAINFPLYVVKINPDVASFLNLNALNGFLPNAPAQIISVVGNVFSNTFFVITTLFFGFYFLLEKNVLHKLLAAFFNEKKIHELTIVTGLAEKRMSSWFWGELALMTTVGVLTYIGLTILGFKYALPLALLAGILEVVPNVGPIISAIPAVLIGFSVSNFQGFAALALYIIVQQLENNLIVPVIMKRAVGLNPIVTLIALIVGGKLGGVIGVLLAIPAYLFIEALLSYILKENKLSEVLR